MATMSTTRGEDAAKSVTDQAVTFKENTEVHSTILAKEDLIDELSIGVAAGEVFGIPELLEDILGKVSRIDVFVVQRVSKTFRNTIQGSKMLQRKMFAALKTKLLDPSNPSPVGGEQDRKTYDILKEMTSEPSESPSSVHTLKKLLCTRWVEKRRFGFFQIQPFHGAYLYDTNYVVSYLHDDTGQNIGWQGKDAIHATGSWERMELGLTESCKIIIMGGVSMANLKGTLPAGSKVSDLFAFYATCRAKAAAAEAAREHFRKKYKQKLKMMRGAL